MTISACIQEKITIESFHISLVEKRYVLMIDVFAFLFLQSENKFSSSFVLFLFSFSSGCFPLMNENDYSIDMKFDHFHIKWLMKTEIKTNVSKKKKSIYIFISSVGFLILLCAIVLKGQNSQNTSTIDKYT